jgi:uncharacterized protein (DUF433 family)
MLDWSQCSAADRDPEKCGGEWCFAHTRMPVKYLFEHIDKGSTVNEFLESFPDLDPKLVHAVLTFAIASLEPMAA